MAGELARRVGLALRAHRESIGMDQGSYGKNMGYHRTYVGAMERGERNLTLGTVERLARQLGIDPLELLKDPAEAKGEPKS